MGEAHLSRASSLHSAVIVVTGVMAAGKSTVAQLLAESFSRAVHVRGDAFRRFIVSGRAEPSPEMSPEAWTQLLLRYRLAAAAADGYAQAGFVAVVQDVITGPSLSDVVDMYRTRDLYLVVLDPDPRSVRERESARPKSGYTDGWTPKLLIDDLRTNTPRIGLWLDTSDLDERETVAVVLDRLNDARITRRPGQ